jgi:hypothetical protein
MRWTVQKPKKATLLLRRLGQGVKLSLVSLGLLCKKLVSDLFETKLSREGVCIDLLALKLASLEKDFYHRTYKKYQ